MSLKGCRVLVVEDDFVIAHDLGEGLLSCGADVVGPAASVPEALDLVTRGRRVDLAVLDVNLRQEKVHPILTVLQRQGVPCLLLTGDSTAPADPQLAGLPLVLKPAAAERVVAHLVRLWHASGRGEAADGPAGGA